MALGCPACGYYAFNGEECFDCGYRSNRQGLSRRSFISLAVGSIFAAQAQIVEPTMEEIGSAYTEAAAGADWPDLAAVGDPVPLFKYLREHDLYQFAPAPMIVPPVKMVRDAEPSGLDTSPRSGMSIIGPGKVKTDILYRPIHGRRKR